VNAVVPPPDGGYPNFTTAEGEKALFSLTTGAANTAVGWFSLWGNTEGSFNTATGAGALLFNTNDNNTAFGAAALLFNTTGDSNVAVGVAALLSNTEGRNNTATGSSALESNTTGSANTAVGAGALFSNTAGIYNTAIGLSALGQTTGQGNIGVGPFAGNNLTTGDFNIDIFAAGVGGESNTIRIGDATHMATYIGGISGATVPAGVTVIVDASGHLGTVVSSQRFKDEVKPMDKASEAILAFTPVTFRYKKEIDPKSIPQFGLVAEEVEKINPDLVMRDKEGKPYSVRYDAVNAMLLNEFLKEHRKVEKLEAAVEELTATVKEQASQLQRVTAQLQMDHPAAQVAANNH